MSRADTKQLRDAILASCAFIALGLYMRWVEAPRPIVWSPIVFGALGIAAVVYRVFRPGKVTHSAADGGGLVLRDGREYRVDVTDTGFALTHKPSSEVHTMAWSEVTFVGIIAIDNFPIGGISFLVHRTAQPAIEVPWDVEGSRSFLNTLQEKLPGFDNAAVIQAASMLHGFKQVWPPEAPTA
jgi:hypothetical protein